MKNWMISKAVVFAQNHIPGYGRYSLFIILGLFYNSCSSPEQGTNVDAPLHNYVELVDPFIDTHNSRWFYFNSASRPFGMVNLSPDTNVKGTWSSGYLYDSSYIRCFSHIHAWQMSGIAVMPTTGDMQGHLGMEAYKSKFSHDGEVAKPGYHKVDLDRYQVQVELTSTTRVGYHRYQFNDNQPRYILFDTGAFLAHDSTSHSSVTRVSDTELEGFAIMAPTFRRSKPVTVYFVAKLDQPFEKFGAWEEGKQLPGAVIQVSGKDAGAYVQFGPQVEKIQMKVAISYVSVDNARLNMETELPHWDFERVKQESFDQWNKLLGRIAVKGGTSEQQVKFYTDLWRSLLGRRIVSDVNGQYTDNTGGQPVVRQVTLDAQGKPLFPHHNFDALWGSHWSLNILWSLAYPEIMDAFCNTMVDMYQNGGLIPRGPSGGNYTFVMIGDQAVPFFASAINKGVRTYDVEKAYEGLKKNAFVGGIRDRAGYEHYTSLGGGMAYYVEQGYVPEGIESKGIHLDGASMTLEYAYQDWCLAQIAKALGKKEDHQFFMKRSQNYKHLWNPATGFMHPREMDGSWMEDFAPVVEGEFDARGFCESNSAIYTHFVPHDVDGLVELVGGQEEYVQFLDGAFKKAEQDWLKAANKVHAANWVDYGNQPGTGMAHMFNKAGAPWLSQKWVRAVKEIYAETTPYGGYHGDEDQGQMGALGALMAMGLFSVDGSASFEPSYEITSPIFDEIVITLNEDYYPGEKFTIRAENNGQKNVYIQSASLNAKAWNSYRLTHETVSNGGELVLTLGPEPNKEWGVTR